MLESKNCHQRFTALEEKAAFTSDDGVDIFVLGARFQNNISYGHGDFPVDTQDMIESSLLGRKQLKLPYLNKYSH
ncbi:hypothetical protein [Mesobacillus harenae]|uniref:hypothetical protein n=1 Tax=Mesobacillus harenae TaxID=2213203 RepID=UPI0015805FC6|nr:hypothetical protein [Mesobacillus harenae]